MMIHVTPVQLQLLSTEREEKEEEEKCYVVGLISH